MKKKYKVSIRQYTGSKSYWVGTQIVFSGEDAAYFYKFIKTEKLDWSLLKFGGHNLSLGRIDRLKKDPANHKAFLTSEGKKNSKGSKERFRIFIPNEE